MLSYWVTWTRFAAYNPDTYSLLYGWVTWTHFALHNGHTHGVSSYIAGLQGHILQYKTRTHI